MAWTGVVGNLVAAEASSRQPLCGSLHQGNGKVVLRQLQQAKRALAIKHRARFHGKVVYREMGGLTGNGLIQLRLPPGQGLAWEVLDEIETPRPQCSIAPGLNQPVDRCMEDALSVPTPQLSEYCIIKALAPQADAIHAMGQNGGQLRGIKGGRVHFKGDFRTRLKTKFVGQSIEQCSDLIRAQQRWRSATDINRR